MITTTIQIISRQEFQSNYFTKSNLRIKLYRDSETTETKLERYIENLPFKSVNIVVPINEHNQKYLVLYDLYDHTTRSSKAIYKYI